jgi:Icc-related predicted phosphoesterase
MKSRGKMHDLWSVMPTKIDILITHGPPKGVRDLTEERDGELKQCGDLSLMKWIVSFRPKAHLFGHIHDMDGIHNQGIARFSKIDTIFSNGTCVHDGKFDLGLTSFGNVLDIR